MFPALLILTCARTPSAPPPPPATPSVAAAAPELSTITIPIRWSLAPIEAAIDARVPAKHGGTSRERGIDIRYDVLRDPIRLQMIGNGLHATSTARYAMEACRGRFPCISCGYGEPRREAEIRMQTTLAWDPAWRLRSTTRALPVHYAKACEVTWLDIDITRRFVAPVIEEQLAAAADIVDRTTPSVTSFRAEAERIWKTLQTPVELAPRTWLVLEPADVALAPIRGTSTEITTTLALQAVTRVVIGNRPAAAQKPLPPLRNAAIANAAGGVRVPFDVSVPWDEASRIASANYANRTYTVGGKKLKVESLLLSPAPGGRVAVDASIDYAGGLLRNYRGPVRLEGTPRFDPATSTIDIPDLDYRLDASGRGFLARIAERAAHESIRDRLRESARVDINTHVRDIRADVTAALNRTLAPGVTLRGRVDAIAPAGVVAADTIVVHVIATGNAEVIVNSAR